MWETPPPTRCSSRWEFQVKTLEASFPQNAGSTWKSFKTIGVWWGKNNTQPRTPNKTQQKKHLKKKKGNHQSTTRFLFGKMGPFFEKIASSPLVAFLSLKKSPWRMWTLHLCEIPPWWLLGNQTFQVWESLALDKKFPKMESTTDEGDEYGSFFCLCLFFCWLFLIFFVRITF